MSGALALSYVLSECIDVAILQNRLLLLLAVTHQLVAEATELITHGSIYTGLSVALMGRTNER